jgi:hypothetical protein
LLGGWSYEDPDRTVGALVPQSTLVVITITNAAESPLRDRNAQLVESVYSVKLDVDSIRSDWLMSGIDFLGKLITVVPRLRTKIQLTGMAVAVAAFVASRVYAPDKVPGQVVAGAIGVNIIVFAQVFSHLELIPQRERARYVLWLFSLFILLTCLLLGGALFLLANPQPKVDISLYQDSNAPGAEKQTVPAPQGKPSAADDSSAARANGLTPSHVQANISLFPDSDLPDVARQISSRDPVPREAQAGSALLSYIYDRKGKEIIIEPKMGLLTVYANGGPIGTYPHEFVVPLPQLSMSVLNPTPHPILVKEIRLDVTRASVDTEPFLFLVENIGGDGKAKLIDAGWGKVINPVLRYSLVRQKVPPAVWPEQFDHVVSLPTFEEESTFNIEQGATKGSAGFIGLLTYATLSGAQRTIKLFERIGSRYGGGNLIPTAQYDFDLAPDQPQKLFQAVAFEVKPNTADRALIRLHVSKSAYISLAISARFANDEIVSSAPIRLHVFQPRILSYYTYARSRSLYDDGLIKSVAQNNRISEQVSDLLDKHKPREAIALIDGVLPAGAKPVEAFKDLETRRCYAATLLSDIAKADLLCSRALTAFPDSAMLHHNVAKVRCAQTRFEDSVREYGNVLAIMPFYEAALINRGLVKLLLGQKSEGASDLNASRSEDGRIWLSAILGDTSLVSCHEPSDPDSKVESILSCFLAGKRDVGKSMSDLRTLDDPSDRIYGFTILGAVQDRLGDTAAAANLYREAMSFGQVMVPAYVWAKTRAATMIPASPSK